IEADQCSAEAIRHGTWEVLRDPQYRHAARRLQDEIGQLPGLEYAVALLEKLAVERTPLIS
ncbi:MAG: glycosyltransferase, partial [Chloroflexota bacterium]|nr:glycosyltransferase [Chloroflexota bacterium]